MVDAAWAIGSRLETAEPVQGEPPINLSSAANGDASTMVLNLLRMQHPHDATRFADLAAAHGQAVWPWEVADPLAGAWLHLGYPAKARQVWQSALQPPSEAVRLARLASTFWVERDFSQAAKQYQQAGHSDRKLAEPHWARAWLYAEQGDAEAGLLACQNALNLSLPQPARTDLENLKKLLRLYVRQTKTE
jgi:hypothetical protein